ncbi:MAG: ATP-grasp domain-containing protein [Clostridiales bacterium]|nr:ATP-grasp domain-containing protein [Clostridiales bacterium]
MVELKGKKLLVLGGMRISCEIIRKAQEMGIHVAVTDYNDPKDSPGKQIADESYMVSTTDVDAVVDLINRGHMDGVLVGFNDLLLPYYADICEKAGLPCYGTRKLFELFTDKEQYKQLCRQYGVPTIEEYDASVITDPCERANVQYPVVVKPTASSGARGITICYDDNELDGAYKKASETSVNGEVLIERYLDEKEATVFWIFQDGEYHVAMIGNRHVKHNQEGVIPLPAGYSFPAAVTDRYLSAVVPKARRMFQSVGVKNGMMFMQCKVLDGECLVYDIGYRLTGSLEYKILKATCGYDPMEMMIRFALTGKMAEKKVKEKVNPYLGKYCYNVSRLCAPGKIAEITGCKQMLCYPGVIDVVTAHQPGEVITEKMKGLLAQITVRVLGTSESIEGLYNDIGHVQRKIQILSETGENLSLNGVEGSDLDGVLADIQKTYWE